MSGGSTLGLPDFMRSHKHSCRMPSLVVSLNPHSFHCSALSLLPPPSLWALLSLHSSHLSSYLTAYTHTHISTHKQAHLHPESTCQCECIDCCLDSMYLVQVCVRVREMERERESVCVWLRVSVREKERVCVWLRVSGFGSGIKVSPSGFGV